MGTATRTNPTRVALLALAPFAKAVVGIDRIPAGRGVYLYGPESIR
jgi:hypothetical protein